MAPYDETEEQFEQISSPPMNTDFELVNPNGEEEEDTEDALFDAN